MASTPQPTVLVELGLYPRVKPSRTGCILDLAATDWETEVGRLIGLGASRIREVQENGNRWITLADPEGNEFDLVRR
jgi:hypothetical protein